MGTFDGVHRGHRVILRKAVALARRRGLRSVVVTFDRPPRLYFRPRPEPTLLTTPAEKAELLRALGVDEVRSLRFGPMIANMAPGRFFDVYFRKALRARAILVGYDFGFGKGRSGDTAFLARKGSESGIDVAVVSPVRFGGTVVSSGRIRDDVAAGNLARANARLGYRYCASGRVVRGLGLGRGLGYPTANVRYPRSKFVPPGVFAVRVTLPGGKVRPGMCNVGTRPTVSRRQGQSRFLGEGVSLEAHVFGHRGSLLGRTLTIEFVRRLRAERKFASLDALKARLARDARAARRALAALPARRRRRPWPRLVGRGRMGKRAPA
jgi:riboflavin kinase / FMN adenylyltransferase